MQWIDHNYANQRFDKKTDRKRNELKSFKLLKGEESKLNEIRNNPSNSVTGLPISLPILS